MHQSYAVLFEVRDRARDLAFSALPGAPMVASRPPEHRPRGAGSRPRRWLLTTLRWLLARLDPDEAGIGRPA